MLMLCYVLGRARTANATDYLTAAAAETVAAAAAGDCTVYCKSSERLTANQQTNKPTPPASHVHCTSVRVEIS